MANSKSNKGASKAQGVSRFVRNAAAKAEIKAVIPNDGKHQVFLKKISYHDVTKDGVPLTTPNIRFWLGIVGTNTAFNAVKWLNADYQSDPVTYEGAESFLGYMFGSIVSLDWAVEFEEKNPEANSSLEVSNAKGLVDLVELARTERGLNKTFIVETKTVRKDGFSNTYITWIEPRLVKAPKAPAKGKKGKKPSKAKKASKGKGKTEQSGEPEYM
jgi:hypothetical protein